MLTQVDFRQNKPRHRLESKHIQAINAEFASVLLMLNL